MKLAKLILAGSMLALISSVALAQQALTGMVTTIDRINGTIAIQQTQSGTVGANTAGAGGATEQFKVQGDLLNTLHAGDKVKFSATEAGGTKTICLLAENQSELNQSIVQNPAVACISIPLPNEQERLEFLQAQGCRSCRP